MSTRERQPTDRQLEVLASIRRLTSSLGYPPTIRELAADLGIRSSNGVSDHLKALERKGCLTRRPWASRAIVLAAGYQ